MTYRRAARNGLEEIPSRIEKVHSKAVKQIPGAVELIALYFALVDPSINPERKVLALAGAGGTGVVGALAGSWVPVIGTAAGAPLGYLIGAYYLLVKKRHVEEAKLYLTTQEKPWDRYPKELTEGELESWQANKKLRSVSAGARSPLALLNSSQDIANRYARVLSHLRALQWSYWVAHWQVKGNQFYGDHLLLERLYKSFDKSIDGLGERITERFGPSFSHVSIGAEALHVMQQYPLTDNPMAALSRMEQSTKKAIKVAWQTANESGDIGLDNFLMNLAEKQDERLYLLGQRTRENSRRARSNQESRAKPKRPATYTIGKKTKKGYPVLAIIDGQKFVLGYMRKPSQRAALSMYMAAQVDHIRANRSR